ncbi:hypothetical protein SK128_005260 [Halocaridina rubra]|uniref:Uncharacterized protein n=1 Tax=Halocaridina rubra TaxID=373956 RepID=A0AAN8WJI6_HALRR
MAMWITIKSLGTLLEVTSPVCNLNRTNMPVMQVLCFKKLRGRGRAPKGCTERSVAIIYDDLPSAPSIVPSRTRPRFKPVPIDSEEVMGMTMGVHLYTTPETRSHPPSEHLYQSIFSGSEMCSYSTSDAMGQDGRALLCLPHNRGGGSRGRRGTPTLVDTDSEEEPLASQGMLLGASDNDTPSTLPSRSWYYCSSAPPPPPPSPRSSSDYESIYYVGGMRRGWPPTPQERGLPPLPSRTDRFRRYFSVECEQQQYNRAPVRIGGSWQSQTAGWPPSPTPSRDPTSL